MTTSVWYLLASLLLASVAGQLYDGDSQSFYENLESSSPAPQSSPSASRQAEDKEVILYLTSEQAEVLKSAGAIVQPLPELSQAQYQQDNVDQSKTQFQPASTEDSNEDKEQDDYFKASNVEQQERESEEDSSIENQSAEETREKSPRNYKYTSKTGRQQGYSALYASKKFDKGKSEYVRYLSNQNIEKVKSQRNRAQPLPNYVYKNINLKIEPQDSSETNEPEPRQSTDIKDVDEFRQVVEDLTRFLTKKPEQAEELTNDSSDEDLSSINDKGPVTFQEKTRKLAQLRELQKNRKNKEAGNKLKVPITKTRTIQRQYSSLLAPLVQHEKITQSIDEQKEELLQSERAIKTKLEQLKESASHDQELYAAEIDKLNKNLLKQNELAQKLALEAAAEQSGTQLLKKPEVAIKTRRPIEKEEEVSKPVPVLVQITKPIEWRWPESSEDYRPIPKQNENNKIEKQLAVNIQKPVAIPAARQYYVSTGKPYLLQKETEYKPEIPSSLAIIRHIWDH